MTIRKILIQYIFSLLLLLMICPAAQAQINADFEANYQSGYVPLAVTFTDRSTGNIDDWSWTFPGGAPYSKSGKGPHAVVYNAPGTYGVSLVVTDFMGTTAVKDTETKNNYITVQVPQYDFGDAPDDSTSGYRYPTLLNHNGARQLVSDSIYLGSCVDAESDAHSDDTGEGDDSSGDTDDEDGVVIPRLVIGETWVFKVKTHGVGYLGIWIDMNCDGDWVDSNDLYITQNWPQDEQLREVYITNVTDDKNPFLDDNKWFVTYIRFRFSVDSNDVKFPYGPGSFGEVEDYQITIYPPNKDSLALVALYNCTDGPHWKSSTQWLNGPLNSWYGVTLTSSGEYISRLDLKSNGLSGSLPPEMGDLAYLEYLDLSGNELSGNVPPETGGMTALTILNISRNRLEGSVPSSLSQLSGLSAIYIAENDFTELPDLTVIPALSELYICNNRFTFEDIEPYCSAGLSVFSYIPQQETGQEQTFNLSTGDDVQVSSNIGGSDNRYQWTQNGSRVGDQTSDTLTLKAVTVADAGDYSCLITSAVVPQLTITRRTVHVIVDGNGGTGVEPSRNRIPGSFALRQNVPNPFNSVTCIACYLPRLCEVTLGVYDVTGCRVALLMRGSMSAGTHTFFFDGSRLSSGIYFIRCTADEFSESMKMLLLK